MSRMRWLGCGQLRLICRLTNDLSLTRLRQRHVVVVIAPNCRVHDGEGEGEEIVEKEGNAMQLRDATKSTYCRWRWKL